jgi:hypothetical protein
MTRNHDRWGDDEEFDPRPPSKGGSSAVGVVLLILGGAVLFVALVCGGLFWFGFRKAQAERAAENAQVEAVQQQAERQRDQAERAVQAARANPPEIPNPFGDGFVRDLPPPKPGFRPAPEPPPQPPATRFATDDPARPTHWRIFFRSKKPELWNTNTQDGDDFAIPFGSVQFATKYLRLRRMDTGEAIIIPMTYHRFGYADPPGKTIRWNGEGKDEHGGYHLGIAEGPVAKFLDGKGTIGILMDGFDANPGSGFGHAHQIDNGGQRFSWMGKEIPPTVFEIALTVEELTEMEEGWLRK